MPAKNSTGTKKNTSHKSDTAKSKKEPQSEERKGIAERRREEILLQEKSHRRKCSILLFAVGVLLVLFVIIGLISSAVGSENPNLLDAIYSFLCGIFGFTVFFTGPIVIYVAVLIATDKSRTSILTKVLQLCFGIILLSSAIQIIFIGSVGENTTNIFEAIGKLYSDGVMLQGGGIVGGLLAALLLLFGRVGAIVLIILIIFVFVMFISRKSLMDFLTFVGKPVKKAAGVAKEKHEIRKEEMELLRKEKEQREIESESDKNMRRINELEMATAENLHQPLSRKQKDAIDSQKKDSSEFLNEINNYNGLPSDNSGHAVKQGKDRLPEIAWENDVHTSVDTLPNLPGRIGSDQTENAELSVSDNTKENEINTSGLTMGDELPPLPVNPPETVNPVEQALDMFISENKAEQTLGEEKERRFEQDLNANTGSTSETPAQSSEEKFDEIISSAEQYVLPPSTLLDEVMPGKAPEDVQKELDTNSTTIVEALRSFGVQTKIVGVCRGPSVTRYELQPAAGVKISRITGLADDIALNLAASGIRIEAPIPGKPAVGIEVPNKNTDVVPFRTLIESEDIKSKKSKLAAVLGKDISGEIIIADIADMPHLLIAGTTGSGKSVCVNSIIMSILFRSTPEEVRFIMIDPKAVEFMIYNGIPHLLIPVVTDPKKAAGALAWAVSEMLRRYNVFAEYNVRNLHAYNSLADKDPEMPKLPQIVIFIDELADLIMASKNEVEDSICRLAQMARAAGMHLVIATQRPTVDVVTGLIKANIPSRIALKVSSGVDSRTIIDEQGAEKLLGKGDMLFKSTAMPKPKRVQGCWISDKEVDRVVTFIKNSFILDYDDDVIQEVEKHAELVRTNDKKGGDMMPESGDIDVADDKLEDAIRTVVEAGQASTSSLQRRLKLGYGRAARLIDIMEEMGIVGPSEGSKPRQVLMTKEEYYERQMNKSE